MTIKEDIQTLKQFEDNYFKANGKYLQGLPTPKTIPTTGSITNFTQLIVPTDETDIIDFIPTVKDCQFRVDVWIRSHEGEGTAGFVVSAKRDLGDGVYETVSSEPEAF